MRGETDLDAVLLGLPQHSTTRLLVIVEAEDASVVDREVLVRVPGAGSEAAEAAVSLEARPRGDVPRGVDLVREGEIVAVLILAFLTVGLEPVRW